MVKKINLLKLIMFLIVVQSTLFCMKKSEYAIYIPEEIWSTIYEFSDTQTIKNLFEVSKKEKNIIYRNKNCIKKLKKHLRNELFKKELINLNKYNHSDELFKVYAKKIKYFFEKNFYLNDILEYQASKNEEKIKCTLQNTLGFSNIILKNINENNNNYITIINTTRENKKPLNIVFFSFQDIDIANTNLEKAENDINEIKNEKNILIIQTDRNDIRNKIFSFLPKQLLNKTEIIHFTKKINPFLLINQNNQEGFTISDEMKFCKNTKIITIQGMNLTMMPIFDCFEKLRHCDLRNNKITEFNINDIANKKNLERVDLGDNSNDAFKIEIFNNKHIVKRGRRIRKQLFNINKEEIIQFLQNTNNQ